MKTSNSINNIERMELTDNHIRAIHNAVATELAKGLIVSPREALAVGVVVAQLTPRLLNSSLDFMEYYASELDDVSIDGEYANLDPEYILNALVEAEFFEYLSGTEVLIAGRRLQYILNTEKKSYPPVKVSEGGITDDNRRLNYGKMKGYKSDLFIEAIHTLESTEYQVSEMMLDIAQEVKEVVKGVKSKEDEQNILKRYKYVIDGTAQMDKGEAYVSEFMGDLRARIYQACYYGPNGQSSDIARAMMDLSGVSKDYDDDKVIKLLADEMKTMGSWKLKGVDGGKPKLDRVAMNNDYLEALANPVDFIVKHLKKEYKVKKPWNFVKFSLLLSEVIAGNKPYIGIAVGLDAKCSGPQLGALQVGDEEMMQMTGFTTDEINDAYENALVKCKDNGIDGLDRDLVKKPFMAVFYGSGASSLSDLEEVTLESHKAIFGAYGTYGINSKGKDEFYPHNGMKDTYEARTELFHKCIVQAFGGKLNKVRKQFKNSGYDWEMKETKYHSPVSYQMPDGFEVCMDYKEKLNLDGEVSFKKGFEGVCVVSTSQDTYPFKNPSFETDNLDLRSHARTGYVNFIQATDGLVARLIVVEAKRIAERVHPNRKFHIVSIHDCFRVNIHDMAILEEAIKKAYKQLFKEPKDVTTNDLPLGIDMLGLYFKGNLEATKEEYKVLAPVRSQFDKNGKRNFSSIKRKFTDSLINNLKGGREEGTTYFEK